MFLSIYIYVYTLLTCVFTVQTHAFFQLTVSTFIVYEGRQAVKTLCDEAISFSAYSPQDCIFEPGKMSQHAFLVVQGRVRYSQDSDTSYEKEEITTTR